MATELPDEIDCRLLADELGEVSGYIPATRLARVGDLLRVSGDVSAAMEFRHDENNRVIVTGEITAPVETKCQRCLEWMPLELGVSLRLVASPSSDDRGSWELDCIIAPDWKLRVTELIEDEILLASPMIPTHEKEFCQAPSGATSEGLESRYKPFENLAGLIGREDDDRNSD